MPGAAPGARRVLITGASGGIGRAAARELLSRGWAVFGGVRRPEDARGLQAELGAGFTPVQLDVTDPDSVRRAVEAVESALGGAGLDALVNCAGIARLGPLVCLSTEALREQFEVNLFGLFEVTRRFLPLLRVRQAHPASNPARPPPRIVNLSSSSGRLAMPFFGMYAASKHALEGLSDSLRRESGGPRSRPPWGPPGWTGRTEPSRWSGWCGFSCGPSAASARGPATPCPGTASWGGGCRGRCPTGCWTGWWGGCWG
jgi:NAD(P)-dependent dehydrogenase (short-subunit alcohol dehydrogenase family)